MKKLVCLLVCALSPLAAWGQTSPTLTFTAETTVGVESVVPKLTWATTPAATSCTASGATDWTGTKAASGTVTLAAINASKTYTLVCNWPGDTSATMTWTAPTQNTDGSSLTNLAGYKAFWGTNSALTGATTRDITNPSTLTTSLTGLATGTWYFGVKAYNSAGTESAMSNIASKTITSTSGVTRTVGIVVNPRPNAPTALTVE